MLQTEVAGLNYSFPHFIYYTNFCALIPFLENRLSFWSIQGWYWTEITIPIRPVTLSVGTLPNFNELHYQWSSCKVTRRKKKRLQELN